MRQIILALVFTTLSCTNAVPLQPVLSNATSLPTHFGLLVFPGFQALDIFGPMDVLNSLFLFYGNSTAPTHLSILSSTLDPVSTLLKGMHGNGDFGQAIIPTITFADYLAQQENASTTTTNHQHDTISSNSDIPSKDWGRIEVLFVPGGMGTRQNMTEEIAFVQAVYPKLKYIISVCTGASILARAGVLDGKRATTNKKAWAWATSTGPNVKWVPTARWVEDGNVFTTSGVSAGIDGAYAWVAHVYGEDVADYLAFALEYPREKDSTFDPWSEVWDVPGATNQTK